MTALDIVNVLTAAAPIVATVASAACKSENTVIERKETPNITNNISVTYNNYFYTNSSKEAMDIASQQMRNQIPSFLNPSEDRYLL